MKQLFQKISAVAMAFLVLFSTLSFSVDMHYCGEKLVDYSFIDSADSCAMEANSSKFATEKSFMDMSMDCCTNLEIVLEGQDDLKVSFDQLSFEKHQFISVYFSSYVNLFEDNDNRVNSFKEYSPPKLIRDIQILDQTFLI